MFNVGDGDLIGEESLYIFHCSSSNGELYFAETYSNIYLGNSSNFTTRDLIVLCTI